MPSPFPGIDPYLEAPELWAEFHNRLIVAIADDLSPKLRPKYRVAIEQRIYLTSDDRQLVGIPDVTITGRSESYSNVSVLEVPITKPVSISLTLPEEVRESYLEIRDVVNGQVVTVIEILSPKNKRNGEGRIAYERKRNKVLASSTHFIEIDLLRKGTHFPLGKSSIPTQYYVLVARGDLRPHGDLYAFPLRSPLPSFPLPLSDADIEPVIDLQTIFEGVYDRAGFDMVINYQESPLIQLDAADGEWAEKILIGRS